MTKPLAHQEPSSHFARVQGIKLHYLDWGGDGPPIVIVHATGFLGRVYRPIARALSAIGHVYSYDQRGHGDSDSPALDEISWYHTADDLEVLLVTLGLRGVRAFGHSAGGTAIAAVAHRRPDLIARAMIVEPVIVDAADPQQRPSELYERTLKRKRAFSSLEAMYANFAKKPPYMTWDPEVLRDYCEHGSRPGGDATRMLKCSPAIEARLYQTAREFDGLSRILGSTVPLLVVFGERSDSPGIEFGGPITRDAPHRRVVIVSGGGHLLPMERPAEIAQMALEFFGADLSAWEHQARRHSE